MKVITKEATRVINGGTHFAVKWAYCAQFAGTQYFLAVPDGSHLYTGTFKWTGAIRPWEYVGTVVCSRH